MSIYYFPHLPTDGLILCLDAGNPKSYPRSGTDWFDLTKTTDASFVGSPVFDETDGGKLTLDGSLTRIATSTMTMPTSSSSVITWVRPSTPLADSTSSGSRRTLYCGPGANWNPGMWMTGRKIRVHTSTQYRDYTIDLTTDTNWHMIGHTYDGTTLYTILDGEVVLGSSTAYSPSTQTSFVIGGEIATTGANAYTWLGDISNFYLYDRALSSAEVLRHYQALKGRFV